jgi:hypothetical protein
MCHSHSLYFQLLINRHFQPTVRSRDPGSPSSNAPNKDALAANAAKAACLLSSRVLEFLSSRVLV